jgi:Protein of unknown function (DUF3307)
MGAGGDDSRRMLVHHRLAVWRDRFLGRRHGRCAMSPTLFPVLLAGHLLGDWVVQNDWEATNKTRSWPALAAHVANYHLVMGALLLIPVLRDGWPISRALALLAVSAGSHAVIDQRAPVRMLMRAVGSPGFATVEWGVIAVDQALHLSILAVLAALLG